jgi:ABC-type transport system involved in cytochrome c biogenesis permease subunit
MLIIQILNNILPVLYGIIILLYGFSFFSKRENSVTDLAAFKRPILMIILVIQVAYFAFRIIIYHHAPITTSYEILTLLAFSITLNYFFIEIKTNVRDTGFFILLIAGIVQLISTIFIQELLDINPVLKNYLLGFHVAFILIGYSAITISGIYGFLYMLLYRAIKENKFGPFYKRLPSLHLLEDLTYSALTFGFIFLSLTIMIGLIWLPHSIDSFSYSDPKLVATYIVWILYAIGFVSKIVGNFQSKTLMKMAFAGFVYTMLSVAFVNIFLSSFHKFN